MAKATTDEFESNLEELYSSENDVSSGAGTASSSLEELSDAEEKVAKSSEDLRKELDDLEKSSSSIITEYGKLYDSLDKLKTGEALNYEQMQALIKIYPDLAKYLQVTADGYSIEIGVLDDLNNALDDNLQKRIEHEKQATYETLRGWEERKKIIEREIATSAQAAANDPMARTAYDAAMSELKEANGEIAELYAKLDTWETTPDYLASGKGKSSSGGGSKSGSKEKEPPGLKTLMSYAKTVSDAFSEQQKNGELALSTVQALIDAGYEQALVYDKNTDKWEIDAEKYKEAAQAQVDAAKNVEGVTEAQSAVLDTLAKKFDDVTNGAYDLKDATKQLTLTAADSNMKMLSEAVVEEIQKGGLSAKTIDKLKDSEFADALVTVDGKVKLDTTLLESNLNDYIDNAIDELEEQMKTANADEIPAIKIQIEAFRELRTAIDDVTDGIYGEDRAVVTSDAYNEAKSIVDERIKKLDSELEKKKELRDFTLKAIDEEVEARKRLTEDNDIQKQIDQVTAQLKYSQLDDFSRMQLERKLKQLETEKADLAWSRGIEDRRAQANDDYQKAEAANKEELQALNDALATLKDLMTEFAEGTANITSAVNTAITNNTSNNNAHVTFNNANNLTPSQIVRAVFDALGIDATI